MTARTRNRLLLARALVILPFVIIYVVIIGLIGIALICLSNKTEVNGGAGSGDWR